MISTANMRHLKEPSSAVSVRAHILNRALDYIALARITQTAFCHQVGIEKKAIRKLKTGAGLSLLTIEKIEAFLDAADAPPKAAKITLSTPSDAAEDSVISLLQKISEQLADLTEVCSGRHRAGVMPNITSQPRVSPAATKLLNMTGAILELVYPQSAPVPEQTLQIPFVNCADASRDYLNIRAAFGSYRPDARILNRDGHIIGRIDTVGTVFERTVGLHEQIAFSPAKHKSPS